MVPFNKNEKGGGPSQQFQEVRTLGALKATFLNELNEFFTRNAMDKKEKSKHLKLVNQRKRRAEAKVSSLTQKLGNKVTTGC